MQWMGLAQEIWGQLRDDELTMIAGRRQQFAGLLRERYGHVKEDGENGFDDYARERKR